MQKKKKEKENFFQVSQKYSMKQKQLQAISFITSTSFFTL